MKRVVLLGTFFPLLAGPLLALAEEPSVFDRVPVADGVYVNSVDACTEFNAGELDFVDLTIEKSGRELGLPEAGCLVASVKQIRKGRFLVESDCLEAGDMWQWTFFLDVIDRSNVRVNGEDRFLCPPLGPSQSQPANVSSSSSTPDGLIDGWYDLDEECRGGSGDDPATERACTRRSEVSDQLYRLGYCFGRKNQSRSKYEWHACEANSIR